MATVTRTTEEPRGQSLASGLRPYRMTTAVYHTIAESGALGKIPGLFLWKGQLVQKVSEMTKGRPHVFAQNRIDRILSSLVPEGYFVEQDQPLDLGEDSEPEPDLKIVRGREREFLARVPTAADTPLVVEVAESSLADDTGEMLRLYAEARVPEYWVVNLVERRIETHADPTRVEGSARYARRLVFGPGESVPVMLDGREVGRVSVDEVLP